MSSPPSSSFLFEGSHSGSLPLWASLWVTRWAAAITAFSLPRSRNLTAFPGGAKELLLRDLDQLFLSSDCRHFNRTESLRWGPLLGHLPDHSLCPCVLEHQLCFPLCSLPSWARKVGALDWRRAVPSCAPQAC